MKNTILDEAPTNFISLRLKFKRFSMFHTDPITYWRN